MTERVVVPQKASLRYNYKNRKQEGETKKMEKYNEIIKSLNDEINKIDKNELISYPEKSYMMFLIVKKMEKKYKSSDEMDLLIFHQALRNWMCEHIAII